MIIQIIFKGNSAFLILQMLAFCSQFICVEERILLLEHMLASHHGQLEFGAIVTPAIPEASVLHALDMIDSRLYIFNNEYENMDEGKLSGNVYALDNNSIYKAYSLDVVDC